MKFKILKNKEKLQKNNKEKSRGRSMVEMLGVLAIIGVLSIGGIQGYTISMRKHRANEVMNVVTKYAMMHYTSCLKARMDDSSYGEGGSATDESGNVGTWLKCPAPIPFLSAGLGGLPQGVESIELHSLIVATTKSADLIFGDMLFTDENLCYTIQSAFKSNQRHYPPNPCSYNHFPFVIYMN